MTEQGNSQHDQIMINFLKARVIRARLLAATAAGLTATAIPRVASASTSTPPPPPAPPGSIPSSVSTGAAAAGSTTATPPNLRSLPYYPQVQGTYTPELIPDILNIAQTAEHLATTLVNAAVQNAATLGLNGLILQTVQAALAEEAYHVQFLASQGAVPLTTTFTVPDPRILTDYNVFFTNLETLETICNAAYMTATREFAELGQPILAKLSYQAGAVEAEHRVMARTALAMHGVTTASPPNNKGFETDLFVYMRDVAALVKQLGFIGGTGQAVTFPGIATALRNAGAMAGAVIQKLPNNATRSATAAENITGERP